jgi:glutathione S-transferase
MAGERVYAFATSRSASSIQHGRREKMGLVFYYAPQSTATVVHWAIEELGIPHEKVKIDLRAGDQKKPEYLKLNPNGKVPLLVHDGKPLFESLAINIHLGETFGVEKQLFPPPGIERAEAIQWMTWMQVTVGDAVSRFLRNTSDRFPAELRNEKAGEAAKAEVEDLLKILDDALAGKEYLAGGRFSLADVHVASWMTYFQYFNFNLTPYKNINAWVARCTARPAFAKTL